MHGQDRVLDLEHRPREQGYASTCSVGGGVFLNQDPTLVSCIETWDGSLPLSTGKPCFDSFWVRKESQEKEKEFAKIT